MMLITLPTFADALDVAKDAFVRDQRNSGADPTVVTDRTVGGFLMCSYLLQALNLKTARETLAEAALRMRAQKMEFDMLDEGDRLLLAKIIKDMYGPLGVVHVFIVGMSPEQKVFVTAMGDQQANLGLDEIRKLLQQVIDAEDAEEFPL